MHMNFEKTLFNPRQLCIRLLPTYKKNVIKNTNSTAGLHRFRLCPILSGYVALVMFLIIPSFGFCISQMRIRIIFTLKSFHVD